MASLPNIEVQYDVASIFLSYFERAPEFEAMEYYAERYIDLLEEQGDDPAAHANAYKQLSAQIYADGTTNGEVPEGPTVTDAWYVNYVYENVLGRTPDESGAEYWVNQLSEGNIERPELVGILVRSAMDGEGRDADYVGNRTFVAVEFAQWENSNPSILDDLRYDSAEVMIGVDETDASVVAAQGRLHESTGQDGETFDLTPGIDTFEGTSYNDTFNAYSTDPATGDNATTLNQFDTIDGGAGYDTLNIFVDGKTTNTVQQGTVSNVEAVRVQSANGVTLESADLSHYEGVEAFWQHDAATDVTQAGADTAVGFADVTVAGEVTSVSASQTLGTTFIDETGTIALQGVETEEGDGGLDSHGRLMAAGEALNTLNINGPLQDDEVYFHIEAGLDVETFTLNTGVDVDLLTLDNHEDSTVALTGLDASGSQGDVMVRTADDLRDIMLGAGNDILVFDEAPTLFQSIDGGEGLDVAALGGATFQTQDYDAINQMTNVEALAFFNDDTAIKLDASQVADFNLLAFGAPNSVVSTTADIHNLAEGQALLVTDDDQANLTLHDAAANVVLDVEEDALATLSVDADAVGDTGGGLLLAGEGSVGSFHVEEIVDGEDVDEEVVIDQAGYDNSSGKFSTIDAFHLDGQFVLDGMASNVAETVLLGDGLSLVNTTVSFDGEVASSSSIGRMDTLAFPDQEKVEVGGFESDVEIIFDDEVTTLQQAFAEAAEAYGVIAEDEGWSTEAGADPDDIGVVWFHFDGDTYLYADTVAFDQHRYDNGDFALKIVGEIEG